MGQFQKIQTGILEGKLDDVIAGVKTALQSGNSADEILNQGLIPAMDEVGRLYQKCSSLPGRCKEVWALSSRCW